MSADRTGQTIAEHTRLRDMALAEIAMLTGALRENRHPGRAAVNRARIVIETYHARMDHE